MKRSAPSYVSSVGAHRTPSSSIFNKRKKSSDYEESETGLSAMCDDPNSESNQLIIRNVLTPLINSNQSIDRAIRELLKKFSTSEAENCVLQLISINDSFKMNISLDDYDLLFRILLIAHEIGQNNCKQIIGSLGIVDPLPFSKFFIDLDCIICHEMKKKNDSSSTTTLAAGAAVVGAEAVGTTKRAVSKTSYMEHFCTSRENAVKAIRLISRQVNKIFKKDISFIVATKSKKEWCGIHLYFTTNLDVVLKQLVYGKLLTLNNQLKTHHMDITNNGILPLCRGYDRFYNHKFKAMPTNVQTLKQV